MFENLSQATSFVNAAVVFLAAVTAIYLFFEKKKLDVHAFYSTRLESYKSTHMHELVLVNNKNNHIPIYSVNIVFNNELFLEVCSFNPPQIIAPYDAKSLSPKQYSKLTINKEDFDLYDNIKNDSGEIYINTGTRLLKCKTKPLKDTRSKFTEIEKRTITYNTIVLTERVKYVINYNNEGNLSRILVIDHHGFFQEDNPFSFNRIEKEHLSPERIQPILDQAFLDKSLHYMCMEFNNFREGVMFTGPNKKRDNKIKR